MKALKLSFVTALLLLAGCAGVRSAYQAAETLEDTAYVVVEHYSALVKEAANLRQAGTLTGSALTRVQSVELRARPVILKLQGAATAYTAVRTAANEAELSKAIGDAAVVISDLINAVKGQPDTSRLEANWTEVTA